HIRQRIRERPAELEATKLKVDPPTRSFEAWQHYFRGVREEEAIHFAEALEAYREAARVDPGFSLAHYKIAFWGESRRLPAIDRNRAIRLAMENIGSLPVKERALVEAWKAHMDGRNDEAHDIYRRAVESFPQDKEVLFLAADLYF